MTERTWELDFGLGPLVSSAIHDAHDVRDEVLRHMILDEPSRLREHDAFPKSACVLATDFRNFFMNKWTGEADMSLVKAIGNALESTVPGVLQELAKQ